MNWHKKAAVRFALSAGLAASLSAWAAPVQVDYTYDPINRLTASTYSTGQQLAYTYDAAGNLTRVAHNAPSGAGALLLGVTASGPGTVQRNPAGTAAGEGGGTQRFEYPAGTSLTLTAQPDSGARFVGWSGACTGTAPACQLTLNSAASAVAAFALNQGGGTTSNGGTIMSGGGTTTVSASTPDGAGTVTAQASGGGATPWVFTKAEIQSAPTQGSAGLPAGITFPFGLIDFELALGQAGSNATVVLTYPDTLPANARLAYYKYGRTQTNPTPHWHLFNGAQINTANHTVTLTLQDGGSGDDDLTVNSIIRDPGGLVLLAAGVGAVAIPTLSEWALVLLTGILGLLSLSTLRRRRAMRC